MAEPAAPLPHPRLELSLVEARTRFVQLARLAGLTQQTTVVTEDGRPLAAIVPVAAPTIAAPPVVASPVVAPPVAASSREPNPAAAGWIRRIDKLRAEFRRQHVGLERALDEAWRELDRVRPPGADREIDALRAAHADLRRPRSAG
jgi:antitoxin (DNA-binding transcriptional repressor) of toxin-antitoxin stability system